MHANKWLIALSFLWLTGAVVAADTAPMDALRARFPHGFPWKVEVTNPAGKRLGAMEMLITSDPERSCLGSVNPGFRVEFVRVDELALPFPITSYGIAKFARGKVQIDLTGGTCDAYSVMDGVVMPDGSASGVIYTFGPGGRHKVATYRAIIR